MTLRAAAHSLAELSIVARVCNNRFVCEYSGYACDERFSLPSRGGLRGTFRDPHCALAFLQRALVQGEISRGAFRSKRIALLRRYWSGEPKGVAFRDSDLLALVLPPPPAAAAKMTESEFDAAYRSEAYAQNWLQRGQSFTDWEELKHKRAEVDRGKKERRKAREEDRTCKLVLFGDGGETEEVITEHKLDLANLFTLLQIDICESQVKCFSACATFRELFFWDPAAEGPIHIPATTWLRSKGFPALTVRGVALALSFEQSSSQFAENDRHRLSAKWLAALNANYGGGTGAAAAAEAGEEEEDEAQERPAALPRPARAPSAAALRGIMVRQRGSATRTSIAAAAMADVNT